jgi:Tfp pilus assembly protein PilX
MKRNLTLPRKNEDGLAALIVVSIVVIILSLTTVAFTKLMGRESQQADERQFSTQAYYAAESGINDAKDYINKHPGGPILPAGHCGGLAAQGYPPYLGPNNTINSKVTCVLADSVPEQLYYPIKAGDSRILQMSNGGTFFGKILVSWQNGNLTGSFANNDYKNPGSTPFYADSTWQATPGGPSTSKAPVIEISYLPMPPTGFSLTNFWSRARTIFLYPSRITTPGTLASTYISSSPDGSIISPSCQSNNNLSSVFAGATDVYYCNTIISPTMSPPLSGTNPKFLFVKITALYGPANIKIRALDPLGNAINIQDAQIFIDATGQGVGDTSGSVGPTQRSSGILKRLQTVIDDRPIDIEPGVGIETAFGLCKRLEYNLSTGRAQDDPSVDLSIDPDTTTACHTAGVSDAL